MPNAAQRFLNKLQLPPNLVIKPGVFCFLFFTPITIPSPSIWRVKMKDYGYWCKRLLGLILHGRVLLLAGYWPRLHKSYIILFPIPQGIIRHTHHEPEDN